MLKRGYDGKGKQKSANLNVTPSENLTALHTSALFRNILHSSFSGVFYSREYDGGKHASSTHYHIKYSCKFTAIYKKVRWMLEKNIKHPFLFRASFEISISVSLEKKVE